MKILSLWLTLEYFTTFVQDIVVLNFEYWYIGVLKFLDMFSQGKITIRSQNLHFDVLGVELHNIPASVSNMINTTSSPQIYTCMNENF